MPWFMLISAPSASSQPKPCQAAAPVPPKPKQLDNPTPTRTRESGAYASFVGGCDAMVPPPATNLTVGTAGLCSARSSLSQGLLLQRPSSPRRKEYKITLHCHRVALPVPTCCATSEVFKSVPLPLRIHPATQPQGDHLMWPRRPMHGKQGLATRRQGAAGTAAALNRAPHPPAGPPPGFDTSCRLDS
jgi:hypothetical protein